MRTRSCLITFFLFFAVVLACIPQLSYSQEESENASANKQKNRRPLFVAAGSLIEIFSLAYNYPVPYLGLGHFFQKDWMKGSFYFGSEVSLFLLRNGFSDKVGARNYQLYPDISNDTVYFRRQGLSQSANKYEEYADLAHHSLYYLRLIDFFSSYRLLHKRTSRTNKIQIDGRGIPSLMLSPFKPKYLKNPWVWGPIVIAGIVGYFSSGSDKPISKASSIIMFGKQYTPVQATLLTAGIKAYRYTLVATGEEMFFRGVIQTELTELTSPVLAVTLSSLFFGLMHIPDHGLSGGLIATAAGLYLGYRYQKSRYDLGEVIGIHFWLDWLPTVIEFVRNPKKGDFVFGISWEL